MGHWSGRSNQVTENGQLPSILLRDESPRGFPPPLGANLSTSDPNGGSLTPTATSFKITAVRRVLFRETWQFAPSSPWVTRLLEMQ